jgi:hypothetical protein
MLECLDPKIVWKHRGFDVDTESPTTNVRVFTTSADTTLCIKGFSKGQTGQYQCVATNEHGEAIQNVLIELATRPTFIQPLMNRKFTSERQMRLDVRVEGNPKPTLTWLKDWQPVAESSRIKFIEEGPYLCSLIISPPLIQADAGVYSCIAGK